MNFSSEHKKRPRQPFWLLRVFVLHVFVACNDAAFEVYLDSVIPDDNLFHYRNNTLCMCLRS